MKELYKKAYYDTMDDICSALSVEHWGIYMWIYRHSNKDTGLCCPSISTLSKECNLSESSIKRKLKELEGKRYIKHKHEKQGKNMSNVYFIETEDKYR